MSEASPGLDKSSSIAAQFVGRNHAWLVCGWERGGDCGPVQGRPEIVAPATPHDMIDARSRSFEPWACALRRQVIATAGRPEGEVSVQLSRALVAESWPDAGIEAVRREVTFARVLLGENPELPRWARTAPLLKDGADLPAAWAEALAREVAGWRPDLPLREDGPFSTDSDPVVFDVFAFSDLLRAAAESWRLRPVRTGTLVSAPVLEIDDPGPLFPAAPVDRDAEGQPVRPLPVVREGRLCSRPRTRAEEEQGVGRSTGSAVRASWRDLPRAGWRSLVVRSAERSLMFPADCWLVSRIIILPGGAVLGAGHRREAGQVRARWGLARLPPPDWWLQRVVSFAGEAAQDATGLPVSTPAAVIRAL